MIFNWTRVRSTASLLLAAEMLGMRWNASLPAFGCGSAALSLCGCGSFQLLLLRSDVCANRICGSQGNRRSAANLRHVENCHADSRVFDRCDQRTDHLFERHQAATTRAR